MVETKSIIPSLIIKNIKINGLPLYYKENYSFVLLNHVNESENNLKKYSLKTRPKQDQNAFGVWPLFSKVKRPF